LINCALQALSGFHAELQLRPTLAVFAVPEKNRGEWGFRLRETPFTKHSRARLTQ
jgi:hypothetical protein